MKSALRSISKSEKLLELAKKSDTYTLQFSNKEPVFAKQTDLYENIKTIPDFREHPVWGILQHLIGMQNAYPNPFHLRLEITRLILWQLGFVVFYTHIKPLEKYVLQNHIEPDQIALSIANISSIDIEEALERINAIYTLHFDDAIALKKDATPLQEVSARLQYFKKDFADQLAWLEAFQENMLDDISKRSFAHFLRERLHAQIFMGACAPYPISPPSITAPYREACIAKHLHFPDSYTPAQAKLEYHYFNKDVTAKTAFPQLIGAEPSALRFFHLDTFTLEQYTIPTLFEAQKGDILIDAGAFIGDTTIYFSRKVGNNGKVYAFEPIPATAELAKQNCLQNTCTNVEIVPLALSNSKGYVIFEVPLGNFAGATMHSVENTYIEGSHHIETMTLDDFVEQVAIPRIDFIKMDVEGAEMNILEGARETIRSFKPDCALCVYHKKNDYWDIGHLLLELCPEYKFYFRCDAEPVLFATVRLPTVRDQNKGTTC